MNAVDWIVVAVIAAVLGMAVWYVIRAKKAGRKCIGCPTGGTCSGGCPGCNKQ